MTWDLLINPSTGMAVTEAKDVESLKKRGIIPMEFSEIRDRVLAREKPVGAVFTEADFFPKGTLPGMQSLIPLGYRAVTVTPGKLKGSRTLAYNNHIDIIAAQAYEEKDANGAIDPIMHRPLPKGSSLENFRRARQEIVARDAIVITPATVEEIPTTKNDPHMRPVPAPIEEMVIAVKISEVAGLEAAIADGSLLFADLRSGLPVTPDKNEPELILPEPPPQLTFVGPTRIETVKGRKHDVATVPSDSDLRNAEFAHMPSSTPQVPDISSPATQRLDPAQPAGAHLAPSRAAPVSGQVDPTLPTLGGDAP
jgi:hypothetical protein